jgi:hypothetical protein
VRDILSSVAFCMLFVFSNTAHSWEIDIVDGGEDRAGRYTSIAFDQQGNPAISYQFIHWEKKERKVHTEGHLRYAHFNGTTWEITTVDREPDVGERTSLAFDADGHPAIAYLNAKTSRLKYASFDGKEWRIDAVDPKSEVANCDICLAFDKEGRAGISYFAKSKDPKKAPLDLTFAFQKGRKWKTKVVRQAGVPPASYNSLAFDRDGRPAIAFTTATSPKDWYFGYAHFDGSKWDIQQVGKPLAGAYLSLAFDPKGRPAISYATLGKDKNSDLHYAVLNGENWEAQEVETQGDTGWWTSLTFDSLGNPSISYWQRSSGSLKFAYFNGTWWDIETVVFGEVSRCP